MTEAAQSAMVPVPYRVAGRARENRDSTTLDLQPVREALDNPQPGEFMMLYAFGIGEIAVSAAHGQTIGLTHGLDAVDDDSRHGEL